MRLAVISDIHGNLEAFREVLVDIERSRVDEVVCLGDACIAPLFCP
jgi:predicted phosphodiesterase